MEYASVGLGGEGGVVCYGLKAYDRGAVTATSPSYSF